MHRRLAITAALAAMAAGTVFAQAPGRANRPMQGQRMEQMQQRRIQRLATLLELTEAQKQQAASIFTDARKQGSALMPQMRTAHTSLREAIKSNDTAQIDAAAAEIGRLHGQMRAIHAKSTAAFYNLLTPEQRQKFDELKPGFGMMGHGGMRMRMRPMRGGPPAR